MDSNIFNDKEAIKHQEAVRKLALLGKCAKFETFQSEEFSKRAFDVMIPAIILKSWWLTYKEEGLDGLRPEDSPELDEKIVQQIQNRYKGLEFVVQDGVISRSKIADLSESRGWSYRTGERWVSRYQISGLLGLAPGYDPLKKKNGEGSPPRDLGSLDESALQVVYERHEKLGDLARKSQITNAEAEARAKEVGVSVRTFRTWWSNFRKHGYAGLAPRQRSDKDSHHVISQRMIKLVQSIRLTKKDATLEYVFETACTKAKELGEEQPTRWQVRRICDELPKDVKLLADKRESQYRNSHKITFPLHYSKVTYLLDTNFPDVLVKDMRSKKYRTGSGEVRVAEVTVFEANARKRVGKRFCYDQPNRHMVAAALRDAFLNYGIPDEIWVDRGKDYISNHVRQLAKSLNIEFKILPPRSPQSKGRLERYYRTKNTELWANAPGYVNSNVKLRNPSAKAEWTIYQLEEADDAFDEMYSNRTHSATGMTPNEYFKEHCCTEPVDPRELDMLLLEPVSRKVTKEGINYEGKKFWHSSLATIVGEYILIRADTRFDIPDEIEVFHNDKWLCTAFTPTSKRGRRVTRKEVGDAQRAQRESARKEIHASEQLIAEVDEEIQATTSAKNQADAPAKDQSEPLKENCPPTEKGLPADKLKNQSNKQSSRSLANDYMQTLVANDTDWNGVD